MDEDNDAVIFETAAIILYLADQRQTLVPPLSMLRARADCLKWLFMLSNTLHAELSMRFYTERYVGNGSGKSGFYETNRQRIIGHLEMLDAAACPLPRGGFLASGLSICDFYLGCLVRWAQIYPVGYPAVSADEVLRFERLAEVLCAVQRRPSTLRSLEKEGLGGPAFVRPDSPRAASATT